VVRSSGAQGGVGIDDLPTQTQQALVSINAHAVSDVVRVAVIVKAGIVVRIAPAFVLGLLRRRGGAREAWERRTGRVGGGRGG
jgi:hypothetical protein